MDTGVFKSLDDVIALAFDPKVDIPTHPPFRIRIEMCKAGSLEDTAMKAQALQKGFQFLHMLFVSMVNPSDLLGARIPLLKQIFRWHLMSWKPMDALV